MIDRAADPEAGLPEPVHDVAHLPPPEEPVPGAEEPARGTSGLALALTVILPGAGHLVHMPSHTFFRVGRYHDSAETNNAPVQSDEA
jgi:hypothetical protein